MVAPVSKWPPAQGQGRGLRGQRAELGDGALRRTRGDAATRRSARESEEVAHARAHEWAQSRHTLAQDLKRGHWGKALIFVLGSWGHDIQLSQKPFWGWIMRFFLQTLLPAARWVYLIVWRLG